ncbi:hypothetical protein VVR84_15540 [Kocuria carniphila]|uniref:Uncharacterized protein n=1 Tax=Kocuria carniphila TaxID=262208 RepID=A0ABV3V5N8_9MICC
MKIAQKGASLRLEGDVPVELDWDGRRWRIIDMPTLLGIGDDFLYLPMITHPPVPWTGWRFTARCEDTEETYLFDLRHTAGDSYEVLRAFE